MLKEKIKMYWQLFFSFAKIGLFTIGGGLAMLPMMKNELVNKKKWILEEELLDYYTVGQSTPGIIAVNVATFVGYKKAGILGGFIATCGMVTPSLIIISILAKFITSISDFPIIQKALKGINVAVTALLSSIIVTFSKKTIKNVLNLIFMLISFALVFFLNISSFLVILVSILIGILITFFNLHKREK